MAIEILADPREISPSQNFLKEKTVRFILECIQNGNEEDLPPKPIVRHDSTGKLVAIDGHNLLAVRAFYGQRQTIHIADSAEDGLPVDTEANRLRNQDLHDKFESSLTERDSAKTENVNSFSDLIAKYPDIFESIGTNKGDE